MDSDFRLSVNPARGTASGLAMAQLRKAKAQDLEHYPSDRVAPGETDALRLC